MAIAARKKAYAPYSKFAVGAVIETNNGKVYTGCNIENVSYGLAICAERVALSKAVSDGIRKFKRIVVVADTKGPCSPCGICRQALVEFSPDMEVVMANLKGETKIRKISSLLSEPFLPYTLPRAS